MRHVYEALRDELLTDLGPRFRWTWCCWACTARWWPRATTTAKAIYWSRVRAIVGPSVVIGAELDLHCHLSWRMVRHADCLVA